MEQKDNGHNPPMERRQHAGQEGMQPPASLLPDILAQLGLSNAPPGRTMSQHLTALSNANTLWQERVQALQALAEFGAQVPPERIAACLKDKHKAVRMAAVHTLGKLAKQRAVPAEYFTAAWRDSHGEVRATVLQVMATLDTRELTKLLLVALKDEDKIVRTAAIQVAGMLGTYAPIHEIVEALHDPEWQVREMATLTLGQIGKGGSLPVKHLVKALSDPSTFVRNAAAFALGNRIPIDILIHDLQYGETPMREQTARILGELGGRVPSLQPLIEAALTDKQSVVRKAAVLALGQQGRRVASKHLRQAAQDNDPDVREAAQLVLETLYPEIAPRSDPDTADDPIWAIQRETNTDKDLLSPIAEEKKYISSGWVRQQETNYVGQQFGSYKLTRLIGDGGLATVYLGEHVYLKTPAAIKVLKVHVPQKDLNSFLTEAQTIAQLRHPRIVRVFDFGVERETPFLVMDYAAKGTLRQRHPLGQQVPLTTVISYVKQVASALQFAHSRGMVHRDVKPENMLLGDNDEVLLSDFGIAVRIEHNAHNTYNHRISGTFPYMAPECFSNRSYPASDQYSLGVVVYEWLCGSRPFSGPFATVIEQQQKSSPPPLHQRNPQLPRNVELVVMRVLAKNPEDRYSSVQAFAEALERASLSGKQRR